MKLRTQMLKLITADSSLCFVFRLKAGPKRKLNRHFTGLNAPKQHKNGRTKTGKKEKLPGRSAFSLLLA
jgi:hypothetical protein